MEDIIINSFKNTVPESFIKNYFIDHKGKKYMVELRPDAPLARTLSIANQLNANASNDEVFALAA
jgi:hypothetical protein